MGEKILDHAASVSKWTRLMKDGRADFNDVPEAYRDDVLLNMDPWRQKTNAAA